MISGRIDNAGDQLAPLSVAFLSPGWPPNAFANGVMPYVATVAEAMRADGHTVTILAQSVQGEMDDADVRETQPFASHRSRPVPGRPRLRNPGHRQRVSIVEFEDTTTEALIREIEPDVLIKGSDYEGKEIAGADFVRSRGGRVVTIPLVPGLSTTGILAAYRNDVS